MDTIHLLRADYNHPGWPDQAAHLLLDVHSGVGIGAIDPPNTLQKTDRRHSYRRFMQDEEIVFPAPILAIASYGLVIDRKDITFIGELFVPRELRGRGLGKKAIELISEEARAEEKNRLSLQAVQGTRSFYEDLGFVKRDRSDDKIFMDKDLN